MNKPPIYSIVLTFQGYWTWSVMVGLQTAMGDKAPVTTPFQALHLAKDWIEKNKDQMKDAAWAAARAAAWAAAWAAAENWQFDRLIEWLGAKEPDDYPLPPRQSKRVAA